MKFFRDLAESFSHAWRGLLLAFRTERSFRVQLAAALVVVTILIVAPLTVVERALLLLVTATVLMLELLNSMVERLADLLKPRIHLNVRDIKDLMAAVVFLASGFAMVIGILILWPHLAALVARV